MKTDADRSAQTPADVLNELRSLVSEAEKILGQPRGSDCEATMAALRARYQAAQERFSDLYAEARRKVITGAKYADEAVREHPYQALAIALGLGLLAGVLLNRRDGPAR